MSRSSAQAGKLQGIPNSQALPSCEAHAPLKAQPPSVRVVSASSAAV